MNLTPKRLSFHLCGILTISIIAFFIGRAKIEDNKESHSLDKGEQAREKVRSRSSRVSISDIDYTSGKTDSERSLRLIERLDNCSSREDFQAELADIQRMSDKSEVSRHLSLLFDAWLREDPEGALSEVNQVESIRHNYGRVSTVFLLWAQENPENAADLIKVASTGLRSEVGEDTPFIDGIDSPAFLLSVVVGLGSQDAKSAAELVASMPKSLVKTSSFELLMQNWLPENSSEVMDWVMTLDQGETRQLTLGIIGEKLGQQKTIKEGIDWALSLENSADQQEALKPLVRQWSEHDPTAAYQWFKNVSDETTSLAVMPGMVKNMMLNHEKEIGTWFDEQTPRADLDPAVITYAITLANLEPAQALSKVGSVYDAKQREATYYFIANRWQRRDPDALKSYLENAEGLPQVLQTFLEQKESLGQ